jgi:hypothetical protein
VAFPLAKDHTVVEMSHPPANQPPRHVYCFCDTPALPALSEADQRECRQAAEQLRLRWTWHLTEMETERLGGHVRITP